MQPTLWQEHLVFLNHLYNNIHNLVNFKCQAQRRILLDLPNYVCLPSLNISTTASFSHTVLYSFRKTIQIYHIYSLKEYNRAPNPNCSAPLHINFMCCRLCISILVFSGIVTTPPYAQCQIACRSCSNRTT